MSQFIDNTQDHRYSRQSYSIGHDAQTKLSNASILVIGYNTLAQEIIRNLALVGVARIAIFVNEKILTQNINTSGLYYKIKNNAIPLDDLKKLNPTIKIECVDILDEDNELEKKKIISQYNLVILTNSIIDDGIDINRLTHKFGIPFIMCGTYGLMGYVFNDWGENFTIGDLDGETPEPLILESIDGELLKFRDEHKLSQDDTIIVTNFKGEETELVVYRKKSPLIVELKEKPSQNKGDYKKIMRKKISQTFNFELLKKNIDNPTHNVSDWSVGTDRSILLHNLHLSMDKYLNDFGELPKPWSIPDWEIFDDKYLSKTNSTLKDSEYMIAKKFCFTLRGDVLPVCSIIGGIVSHEVFKVLAHKYIPIQQWYYMDCLDLISDSEITSHTDYTCRNYKTKTKYDGLVNVFGKKFLETIQNTIPFVVGSGAIGCELVKNLGMLGVKRVYLTDPDHIEKSNLSRQFLFADSDIRQSKSTTASKKIKLMNPDVEIIGLEQKICPETENYFNSEFHSKIDIYLNALDNVDARIYMDSMAIKYSKPLIDSGTMGSKGNVQVIIPHLTESYGSSKDPDEKAGIPICTIKAFPYKPEHTIQWARELFETEFNLIPFLINKYKNLDELNKINDADSKQLLRQLYKYDNFELTPEYYNKLLGTIWRENFYDNIKEILDKYSKEENKGELGDKKLPEYLSEHNNQTNKMEFYKYGFKLLNQMFNSDVKFLISVNDEFTDSVIFDYDMENIDSEIIINILNPLIKCIPQTMAVEFEKDDDDLGHVQWISLCSNMRNFQYSIPQTDLWEVRKIAGNIIPALITTTSLISGFQILEFIRILKLYQSNKYLDKEAHKDIDMYKNRFVNLNTNYCDGINPSPSINYKLDDGKNVSIWTNFKTSHINTNQIINQIEFETKKKIEFMTQGNKTVYDGDDISIDKIDIEDKTNILVLLEDIPIGIPLVFSD
jgi:ubiquitin-activating enzyme E1